MQGWNGFAIHRADEASSTSVFDYSLKNIHLEQGEDDDDLDLYENWPAEDEYEGSWQVESWVDSEDEGSFTVIVNRYLPWWSYDVYEYNFNDCRWSPHTHGRPSPQVKVKGYFRNESGRLLDEDEEGVEIIELINCETDNNGVETCEEQIIISWVKIYWTHLTTL